MQQLQAPMMFGTRPTAGPGYRRQQAELSVPMMFNANRPDAPPSAPSDGVMAPGYRNPATSYAPGNANYVGGAPIANHLKTATSIATPPPGSAPLMLNAPSTPGQFAGYNANMQTARNNANFALSAPGVNVGPLPTGGSASFTDEQGRTITRNYGTPGQYSQSSSGGAPGAPALSPELAAPGGKRFEGYTPGDAARINDSRVAYAASQNARADGLNDAMLGAPGMTAYNRNAQEQTNQNNDTARGLVNAQAGEATARGEAAKTTAGAKMKEAGTNAEYSPQSFKALKDTLTQRDKVIDDLSKRLQALEKGAAAPKPAAATPAAPKPATPPVMNYNDEELRMIRPGVDENKKPTPPQMSPEAMQAMKRGQYSDPRYPAAGRIDTAFPPGAGQQAAQQAYSGPAHPNLPPGATQTGPDTIIVDGKPHKRGTGPNGQPGWVEIQ